MTFDGYEHLKLDIENTLDWRGRCCERFPDDRRNADAVGQLKRLYETVDDVPPQLMTAYTELCEHLADIEKHQDMLRAIGFHEEYLDATAFVRHYIADRCGA